MKFKGNVPKTNFPPKLLIGFKDSNSNQPGVPLQISEVNRQASKSALLFMKNFWVVSKTHWIRADFSFGILDEVGFCHAVTKSIFLFGCPIFSNLNSPQVDFTQGTFKKCVFFVLHITYITTLVCSTHYKTSKFQYTTVLLIIFSLVATQYSHQHPWHSG